MADDLEITIEIWKIAAIVCTPEQLRVLELREKHRFSWRTIGFMLNRDQASVRGMHGRAVRRIHNHLEQQKETA